MFCAASASSIAVHDEEILALTDQENQKILIIVGTLICSILVFLMCLVTLSILQKRGHCKGLFRVICCCCKDEPRAGNEEERQNENTENQGRPEMVPYNLVRLQQLSEQEKKNLLKLYEKDLKKMIYSKSEHKEKFTSCVICFEDFQASTKIRETRCGHLFHSKCILDWIKLKLLNPDCPSCR